MTLTVTINTQTEIIKKQMTESTKKRRQFTIYAMLTFSHIFVFKVFVRVMFEFDSQNITVELVSWSVYVYVCV